MNLTEELHRAVADAPPTRIDLEALIVAEGRRRVRVRWLAGAGGASAVLALVLAAPIAMNRVPPFVDGVGRPGADPSIVATRGPADPGVPTPTEPADKAATRLTTELRRVVGGMLPPGTLGHPVFVNGEALGEPLDQIQVTGHPEGGYKALLGLQDSAGLSHLSVLIRPAAMPQEDACQKNNETMTCVRETRPDGSVEYWIRSTENGRGLLLQAESYRPDGTSVMVSHGNVMSTDQDAQSKNPPSPYAARDGVPLSLEALRELARTPGLTLFP